jgi:hypothetical protein
MLKKFGDGEEKLRSLFFSKTLSLVKKEDKFG